MESCIFINVAMLRVNFVPDFFQNIGKEPFLLS
jgi:hypothetical protein